MFKKGGMKVSFERRERELVLSLITLRTAASGTAPVAGAPAAPSSRAERAQAARAADRAAERRAKDTRALLKAQAAAAEASHAAASNAAAAAATAAKAAARISQGATVRLNLCTLERPSERKPVVLRRAQGLDEVFKAAKAKLRLKKLPTAAHLLETSSGPISGAISTAIASIAELDDGALIGVTFSTVTRDAAPPVQGMARCELNASSSAEVPAQPPAHHSPAHHSQVEHSKAQNSEAQNSEAQNSEAPKCTEPSAAAAEAVQPAPSSMERSQLERSAPLNLGRQSTLLTTLHGDRAASEQHALSLSRPPPEMISARASLPIAAQRSEILSALEASDTLVLQGATGSGKSTQLPQFLLESAITNGTGAEAAIVVTQPRRVCAVSLAQRVAEERGEKVGEVVGYAVRGESRRGPRTRILFCTTGLLLRHLGGGSAHSGSAGGGSAGGGSAGGGSAGSLGAFTHIICDEVHERQVRTLLQPPSCHTCHTPFSPRVTPPFG